MKETSVAVVLTALVLTASPLHADGPGAGQITLKQVQIAPNCRADVTVDWNLRILLGEPLVYGNVKYDNLFGDEGGCSDGPHIRRIWLQGETTALNVHTPLYIPLVPLWPEKPDEWGLRYPGRVLQPGELIPSEVVAFIAVQLGIAVESLLPYAARSQTRHEHMTAMRSIYGYRTFAGRAASLIRDGRSHDTPRTFLRPTSKWHRYLDAQPRGDKRLWEVAVLSHLRDGFRSGDLWLPRSRRHGDPTQALVPLPTSTIDTALAVPLDVGVWLADRQAWMALGLERLAKAARTASIPGGVIRDGGLNIDRLTAEAPEGVDELILDLYKRLPETRITDLLVEVDDEVGFTDAFVHLRTGAPCKDRIGLMNVLLAEGINLSLGKMADSTNTHDYWELMRLSRWHVEGEAFARALEMVIDAQARLPMAKFWGPGTTASSDGQFFPTTRQGEAMNLVNARYGNEPGLKAYTHVSDRFGPFATQVIPATAGEAPYILDGLLMNETGRHIREQYADTGGFTDHVFAVTSILGYRFVPRIRDLPSKRIYLFDPAACPRELRGLIGGKLRQSLIALNWPDILRLGATLAAGTVAPSLILRKLAAYPRRNDLAAALREVGRIERTLFMLDWALDPAMQRRAQIGLNKGESHHALKNALRIGRQGEIRDRSTEGQHYRMAGLNLLAAIVIYWNTVRLGEAVARRRRAGLPVAPELLAHTAPLGWGHLLINGEYKWPRRR